MQAQKLRQESPAVWISDFSFFEASQLCIEFLDKKITAQRPSPFYFILRVARVVKEINQNRATHSFLASILIHPLERKHNDERCPLQK